MCKCNLMTGMGPPPPLKVSLTAVLRLYLGHSNSNVKQNKAFLSLPLAGIRGGQKGYIPRPPVHMYSCDNSDSANIWELGELYQLLQ